MFLYFFACNPKRDLHGQIWSVAFCRRSSPTPPPLPARAIKLGRKQKTGEGTGEKETLACAWACPQTHERSFWLVRCWQCWLNSNQYINQTRYVLFTCVADLVWSDLWSQITNALVWYLFESCFCEGLSDLSLFDQKYIWRSSSGD